MDLQKRIIVVLGSSETPLLESSIAASINANFNCREILKRLESESIVFARRLPNQRVTYGLTPKGQNKYHTHVGG